MRTTFCLLLLLVLQAVTHSSPLNDEALPIANENSETSIDGSSSEKTSSEGRDNGETGASGTGTGESTKSDITTALAKANEALTNVIAGMKEIYPATTSADREQNSWYKKLKNLKEFNDDSLSHLKNIYDALQSYKNFVDETLNVNERIQNLMSHIDRWIAASNLGKDQKNKLKYYKRDLKKTLKAGSLNQKSNKLEFVQATILDLFDPNPPTTPPTNGNLPEILKNLTDAINQLNSDDDDYYSIFDFLFY